jgi:hypothetical protein
MSCNHCGYLGPALAIGCRFLGDVASAFSCIRDTGPSTRSSRSFEARLEWIHKLDEWLCHIPHLDANSSNHHLQRIKRSVLRLLIDEEDGWAERMLLQGLPDSWTVYEPFLRLVEDFALLCCEENGHIFKEVVPTLEAFQTSNIIKIHVYCDLTKNSLVGLVVKNQDSSICCPVSDAAKQQKKSRFGLEDLTASSDQEWHETITGASPEWRSLLAEMLHIVRNVSRSG